MSDTTTPTDAQRAEAKVLLNGLLDKQIADIEAGEPANEVLVNITLKAIEFLIMDRDTARAKALDLRDTVDYRACRVHGKDYLAGCHNCDRNAAIDAFDAHIAGEKDDE